ncbi:MAG: hypothetical protein LLG37_06935 [Spirochaetia bacterium]|nr:hypothetical protein [Spirochaetia bacterium]
MGKGGTIAATAIGVTAMAVPGYFLPVGSLNTGFIILFLGLTTLIFVLKTA